MLKFPVTFLLAFGAWIFFTASLNIQELIAGVIVSLVIAYIAKDFIFHEKPSKALNPIRWVRFVAYFFVWLYLEIVANLDVAYRILTGRINPAIVEVPTKFRTDIGRALLGNSITLTPGTLTIKAGENLFVHWIAYSKRKRVGHSFERFGLEVTE
jgi:multicomponent Na+:H+ antiporter subunit E